MAARCEVQGWPWAARQCLSGWNPLPELQPHGLLCLGVPGERMASVLGVQAGPVRQLGSVSQCGSAAAQISQLALASEILEPLGRVPSMVMPSPQLLVHGC